jgi:hypothetical protein
MSVAAEERHDSARDFSAELHRELADVGMVQGEAFVRGSGGIAVSDENAVALHWYTREFFPSLRRPLLRENSDADDRANWNTPTKGPLESAVSCGKEIEHAGTLFFCAAW